MAWLFWATLATCFTVAISDSHGLPVPVYFIGDMTGGKAKDGAQFDTGFDMAVEKINGMGLSYTLSVTKCDTSSTNEGAEQCVTDAAANNAAVIVAGTASTNVAIIAAAQDKGIPNIHCSGGNPAMWQTENTFAVGLHVPFLDYTKGLMQYAESKGLQSIGMVRSTAHGFPKASCVAALKWARDSGLRVIGPSAAWCEKWANKTETCRMVGDKCRCGKQDEVNSLVTAVGATIDYNIEGVTTFYEINENALGNGFSVGDVIDDETTAFMEGIIQDMKAQGAPVVFLNFAAEWHNSLNAMVKENYSPQMLMGWQGGVGLTWAAQVDVNGNEVLSAEHGYGAIGFGQWHKALVYSDPVFTSTTEIVQQYATENPEAPDMPYNTAGGAVAGVLISEALKVSGAADSADNMREAIRGLNFESLWGPIMFNDAGQAEGRGTAAWQIIPDTDGMPKQLAVMPVEAQEAEIMIPFPPWCSRFGNECEKDGEMTCADFKKIYKQNGCCHMPNKPFIMPSNRRLLQTAAGGKPQLIVREAMAKALKEGGRVRAMKLAEEIAAEIKEYSK